MGNYIKHIHLREIIAETYATTTGRLRWCLTFAPDGEQDATRRGSGTPEEKRNAVTGKSLKEKDLIDFNVISILYI